MNHKIFLSHNHNDKPLVEAVALRLANIFGQDQVFYDSWTIRPGDGIIDKMNSGLIAPEFFFFFVSTNSLASEMVKLEWQNALYAATKGKTRIIPVRIDSSDMPAVLRQTLFIDMHTIGFEAALSQIVNVTQENTSFTPQHQDFSNLTYSILKLEDGSIEITIKASHVSEPNPNFSFPVINEKDEISWWIKGQPATQGAFIKDEFQLNEGGLANAITMRPITGILAPNYPLTFHFKKRGDKNINLIDVLHDQGQNIWTKVPFKQ